MTDELSRLPARRIREPVGVRDKSPDEMTWDFLDHIEEYKRVLRLEDLDNAGLPNEAVGAQGAMRSGVALEPLRSIGAVATGPINMPVFADGGGFDYEKTARCRRDASRTTDMSRADGAVGAAIGLSPIVVAFDGGGSSRLLAAYRVSRPLTRRRFSSGGSITRTNTDGWYGRIL